MYLGYRPKGLVTLSFYAFLNAALFSSAVFAGPKVTVKNAVIYGQDDRFLAAESPSKLQSMVDLYSPSIAVRVDKHRMRFDQEGEGQLAHFLADSLKKEQNLCSTVRFADVPTGGECTGFLVGNGVLATAGHCARSVIQCQQSVWIFNYRTDKVRTHKNEKDFEFLIDVPQDEVYRCKRIIRRAYDRENKLDFALIELDRETPNKKALPIRKDGRIADQAEVAVLGHPTGLPLILGLGAKVRENKGAYRFFANLDSFKGNSGSPVINLETLQVEGILVSGDTDFVFDRDLKCRTFKQCTNEGCEGEGITRINMIPELVLPPELIRVFDLSEIPELPPVEVPAQTPGPTVNHVPPTDANPPVDQPAVDPTPTAMGPENERRPECLELFKKMGISEMRKINKAVIEKAVEDSDTGVTPGLELPEGVSWELFKSCFGI